MQMYATNIAISKAHKKLLPPSFFFFARQDQVLMSKNPFYQLIDHCQSGPVASSIGYYRATVSL